MPKMKKLINLFRVTGTKISESFHIFRASQIFETLCRGGFTYLNFVNSKVFFKEISNLVK